MSTWRQHTLWDPGIATVNRWRISDAGDALIVRFRMASEPEHVVTLPLAEAKPRAIDGDTFVTKALEIQECVGRIEFVLRGAPDHVVSCLREALDAR